MARIVNWRELSGDELLDELMGAAVMRVVSSSLFFGDIRLEVLRRIPAAEKAAVDQFIVSAGLLALHGISPVLYEQRRVILEKMEASR